jgi:CRP-like cAMP-binding protein
MKGHIARFRSRADMLRLDQAAELRQLVLKLEDQAPTAVRQLLSVVDRHTAASKGWTFVMMSPMQNRDVCRWIFQHAKRPHVSIRLWTEFFCHLRMDTGEIVMTRKEMAEAAGTTPDHVSSALSELVGVGALIRHREGREVRWFMNPNVGTCLTGKAREDAQGAAPKLSVVPVG